MMDFLKREQERHAKLRDIVKDFSVFDFGYIPDEPFMREESKYLIKELARFEISGIPTHLAVIGTHQVNLIKKNHGFTRMFLAE